MPRIEKYCMVGAFGWNHPDWAMSYYPHDIPVAWRLSFFAHEFDAVLLPQAEWVEGDASYRELLEEVQDTCQVLLQLDWGLGPAEREQSLERLEALGGLFSGIVVQGGVEVMTEPMLFGPLATLVDDEIRLVIDSSGEQVRYPDRFEPIWHSDQTDSGSVGATLGMVRGWQDRSDAGLRQLVDRFVQQAPIDAVGLTLIFADHPPSMVLLSRIQALLEEMGLSDRR